MSGKKQVFNPYLPSYEYVPDGEPHVFGDRIYLYGSHDRFNGAEFCLNDYICYSADVKDLTNWKYEGVILRKDQDPRNQNIPKDAPPAKPLFGAVPQGPEDLNSPGVHAQWAPDVVKGFDKRYYLYYCLDYLPQISVAVCDTPAGEYEYLGMVKHADGTVLGEKGGDKVQFDPGIFIDDDGTIYLYSGNAPMKQEHIQYMSKHGSQVMKLEQDMLTIKEEPKSLLCDLRNSAGTEYEGHEFFEASSIRKINGKYYFVYSSLQSHELCYAVSNRPDEGYQYGGTLVDIGDVFLDGRTEKDTVNCLGNTHGGIECADGQWYIFYHRQTNRTNFSRQGCAEKVYFNEDGSIAQAEVTSCGLNQGALEGNGIYPAQICCHLTGKNGNVFSDPLVMKMDYPFLTQDLPDISPDSELAKQEEVLAIQYVANVMDGTTIGFKYFNFENIKSIKVQVRQRKEPLDGKFVVSTKPGGLSLGEITVETTSIMWEEFQGNVDISDGVQALYFTYVGCGALDFVTFELII
ncbi:MAG: family 43 glycosylhydrolase [Lachnotalea sp.]